MSAINKAKTLINEFVEATKDCKIYIATETNKVCFGANKIVQLYLRKNVIVFKLHDLSSGDAKYLQRVEIALTDAEMFTIKHHFKKTHQMKDIKIS